MTNIPTPRPANVNKRPGKLSNLTTLHLRNRRVGFSPGVLVDVTPRGTFVRPRIITPGPGGGASVQQLRVHTVEQDYMKCRSYNGGVVGTEDILVALPFKLRRTPFDGQTIVYDRVTQSGTWSAVYHYISNLLRTVTIEFISETQLILPRYRLDGDIIYAIDADTDVADANGNPVTLLDINADGRAWARI